ncbi:MAG: acyltransferase [Ruminococcus sp.]|nr:acyltransferase [Ruminococcus sp.]
MSGKSGGRNYFMDVVKLILTVFVFINHTLDFKEGTVWPEKILYTGGLGWVCVHYFFVISGFLMVMSFFRRREQEEASPGRSAAAFVWRKFRSIGLQYYAALIPAVGVYLYTVRDRLSLGYLSNFSFHLIPEMLLINRVGIDPIYINLPTWYIQCMLLCMIPLYCLLCRNSRIFLNVIAPMGALLGLSFMFRQDSIFISAKGQDLLLTNGLIRGFTGLLCGCCGYLIYERLRGARLTKAQHRLFSVLEVLLYLWMIIGCFTDHADTKGHFLAMLLIPPATALSFSGAGVTGGLFSSPVFSRLGGISLALYLNNWSARRLVMVFFPGMSWTRSTAYMAAFTVGLCLVYWLIIAICRALWSHGLKELFTLEKRTE